MTRAERAALAQVVAVAPPDRRLAAATIATGTVTLLAGAALLALSGALISKAALQPPVLALSVLIVGVRAVGLVRALARYGERIASHDLAFRALGRLRSAFFGRLVALGARAGDGDLLSRFVGDVDQLQALYLRALGPPFTAAVTAVVTVLAAGVLLPAAAVVLAAGLLTAGVAVPLAVAAIARRAARRQAAARAQLSAELLELARCAPELAVAGRGADRIARVAGADGALHAIAVRDALAGAAGSGLSTLAQGGAVVGVLLVAVPATGSALEPILLAALTFLTMAAFEATQPLAGAAQQLGACAAAAARLTDVLGAEPSVRDPAAPQAPGTGALAVERATVDGVFETADLRIEPGEAVALVGPSGAGKSTLARLLVRFADPARGRVTLAGTDVRDLRQEDLRAAVRLIASDEALFTTTVAENVRLARPAATDAELTDALVAAGLGPWLDSLPDGLDTVLGEDGTTVSGGQRRRLAVARAFLCDAAFLVVDEPGEHLDPASASALLQRLAAHARARGQGLLAVVHGDDLRAFDRVVELRGGRLAA
jgi:thiol reductant ABC exporter CydC subunit